jgi:hypothetical protein
MNAAFLTIAIRTLSGYSPRSALLVDTSYTPELAVKVLI